MPHLFSAPRVSTRLCFGFLAATAAASVFGALAWTTQSASAMVDAKLDMCALTPTFTEEFDTLEVASREIGQGRWIAHTPWNGDFGDAAFADPGAASPFKVENGILSITASKDSAGKWRSGFLASADAKTNGFSQQYGYFEARAKLPAGTGLWPAFWLGSSGLPGGTEPSIEIDVIEHYGHAPGAFSSAFHIWHKNPTRDEAQHHETKVPSGSLYEAFHTYGVSVKPDFITYYLDREPIWQVQTPSAHKMPLLLMVNLTLGSGFPIDKTPDPSVMLVDYIHAYQFSGEERNQGCADETPD